MADVSHNVTKLSKNDPKTLNGGLPIARKASSGEGGKLATTLKFFKIASFYWLFRNANVQELIKDILLGKQSERKK